MRVNYPDGPLHRPQQNEVFLEETEIEYLLYIHYKRKNLAYKIPDRHFDGVRLCWVYPKTVRHYNALVRVFGDELERRPDPPSSTAVDYRTLSKNERALAKGVGDLRAVIETRARKDVAAEHVIFRLEKTEGDLKKALERINDQAMELDQALLRNTKLREAVGRLEAEKAFAQSSTGGPRSTQSDTHDDWELLKTHALAATGNDPVFGELLKSTFLDGRFPLVIAEKLAFELRKLVGEPFETAELFDLVKEADRRKLLSGAAMNCAHLIRIQRNLIAHPGEEGAIDERALKGRIALCLFAAAIVWPELPE